MVSVLGVKSIVAGSGGGSNWEALLALLVIYKLTSQGRPAIAIHLTISSLIISQIKQKS